MITTWRWLTQTISDLGSGNRLLPDGTKPLPEPMLTNQMVFTIKIKSMIIYSNIINAAIKLLKLTQFSTALLAILARLKLSQNIFLSCRCDTHEGIYKAIKKLIFHIGWDILMSVKPRLYFIVHKCSVFLINFHSITKQDHSTKLEPCLENCDAKTMLTKFQNYKKGVLRPYSILENWGV